LGKDPSLRFRQGDVSLTSIGIVGLGKMGILHAGILNALPNCKLVAICEKETMISKLAKKILPDITFCNSVPEMIETHDIDAVFITTPIVSHAPIVDEISKVSRQVNIFVEKPLAGSLEDAKKILAQMSSSNTTKMIGFQKRFAPQFRRTKELLDKKALGDLLFFKGFSFVSSVFSDGSGWRFKRGAGGSLLDLGSHLLDLILWYFGAATSVSAVERSFYSSEVEDYTHVTLNFAKLVGSIDVSWSIRGFRLPETQIEIHGKNGSIFVDDDSLRISTERDIPGVISAGNHKLQKPDLVKGVDFLLSDAEYCLEDRYFLDCLSEKKPANPGLEAGVEVNRLVEQIHSVSQER
jgi:predicted dehydrogenase